MKKYFYSFEAYNSNGILVSKHHGIITCDNPLSTDSELALHKKHNIDDKNTIIFISLNLI